MKELKDMDKPELFEIIRIKDVLISELRNEVEIYRELADQLQKKLASFEGRV